jgi:very-short-patch-repair endonuclease
MVSKKTIEFIKNIRSLHGDKFQYDKLIYINIRTKILIGYKDVYIEVLPSLVLKSNYIHNSIKYKTDIFIEKLSKVMNIKDFDFSRSEYINNTTYMTIGYKGIFYEKTPANLLKGSNPERGHVNHTEDSLLLKFNSIHNFKYKYIDISFSKIKDKIKIECSKHGNFTQVISDHLNGHGCPKCGKETTSNKVKNSSDKWRQIIREKHGNKYLYYNIDGELTKNKILYIRCDKHGDFSQKLIYHKDYGCKKCGYDSIDKSERISKFILSVNKKWSNFYNYDKFEYVNSSTKSIIICPIHGEFLQTPNTHLKCGCKKCGYDKVSRLGKMCAEEFFNKCNNIHNFKYDYSESIYINSRAKIKIICPLHGIFIQCAQSHMSGSSCPNCRESKGERQISLYLNSNNIEHIRQYKFNNCKNKYPLPFDFYLVKYNICIEFDGIQHFKSMDFFGGDDGYEYLKINDNIKDKFCLENNIKLIRIPYYDIKNIEKILKNELKIDE